MSTVLFVAHENTHTYARTYTHIKFVQADDCYNRIKVHCPLHSAALTGKVVSSAAQTVGKSKKKTKCSVLLVIHLTLLEGSFLNVATQLLTEERQLNVQKVLGMPNMISSASLNKSLGARHGNVKNVSLVMTEVIIIKATSFIQVSHNTLAEMSYTGRLSISHAVWLRTQNNK